MSAADGGDLCPRIGVHFGGPLEHFWKSHRSTAGSRVPTKNCERESNPAGRMGDRRNLAVEKQASIFRGQSNLRSAFNANAGGARRRKRQHLSFEVIPHAARMTVPRAPD
jgi:hypothetical protein